MVASQVYKIEIILCYSNPKIYREVLVKSDTPMTKFHEIIIASMGWFDCHMHQFETKEGKTIVSKDFAADIFGEDEVLHEEDLKLDSLLKETGDKLLYTYDMGDNWDHLIVLQEIMPVEKGTKYPQCIGGARACPLEDSGGIDAYEHLLEVLADKKDPEHKQMSEWVHDVTGSKKYDPNHFDKKVADRRLADI